MLFDGEQLIVIRNGYSTTGMQTLYKFDKLTTDFHDMIDSRIDWLVRSQKLHFSAPNNYKHIRSLSIVTDENNTDELTFNLVFKNYRNLNNLSSSDVVEFEVTSLTTVIKRVNFIKTNAFQFEISNYKRDKTPHRFVTPNIAIKFRVTERVR